MSPYSLKDLRTALQHPRSFPREFNRLYHTRLRRWEYNRAAPNIFEKDWDNLLILDACRYDAFERVYGEFDLPGNLGWELSRGSSTMEFMKGNINGTDLTDTVYVTGTTMLYRNSVLDSHVKHNLHDVVDVWEEAIEVDEWGIRPDRMANEARAAAEQYPNKRLVVHFIQPHIPFIGEFGRERFGDVEGSLWRKQRRGDLGADDADLWRAYMENLRMVVPAVADLLGDLPGKSVVSADHGQLIGERQRPLPFRDYGHPTGIYRDELVKVPWLEYDGGHRKRVEAGDSNTKYDEKNRDDLDDKAEEHLRNLGYL